MPSSMDAAEQLQNDWPPNAKFDPPNLDAAGKWVADRVSATIDAAEKLADHIEEDVKIIYGAGSACFSEFDRVRLHAMHRALEHGNEAVRQLLDPAINLLQKAIFPKRNPKLTLWLLKNPSEAFKDPNKSDVTKISPASRYDLKYPVLYIHGMSTEPIVDPKKAVKYWQSFEQEYKLYASPSQDHPALIANWDSEVKKADMAKIAQIVAIAGPDTLGFLLGAAFREMQRRAESVGLSNYFPNTSGKAGVGIKYERLFSVTHSLGSLVWANTVHWAEGLSNNRWWSFQPAVPFDNFGLSSPRFVRLLNLYETGNGRGNELITWYSPTDKVLLIVYPLGGQKLAMGTVGPQYKATNTRQMLKSINVSQLSGETHGPDELVPNTNGYFTRIGSPIRANRSTPF